MNKSILSFLVQALPEADCNQQCRDKSLIWKEIPVHTVLAAWGSKTEEGKQPVRGMFSFLFLFFHLCLWVPPVLDAALRSSSHHAVHRLSSCGSWAQ